MIRVLLLSLLLLTACRTIKRASSSSSATETAAESSKYNREVITEYVVRDTSTGKPVIVNVMPGQPGQIKTQDPIIIHQKEPYIIRQTIRESGENQATKTEQIQTETKEKEASMPFVIQVAALVVAISIALIAIAAIIFLIKK